MATALVAKGKHEQGFVATEANQTNWRAKIAAALFADVPFEPVFEVDGKKVRIKKIAITHEQLAIQLVPASE